MAGGRAHRRVGRALLHLWQLSRPEVWMVSVLPVYVGWVLATGQLLPVQALWFEAGGALLDGQLSLAPLWGAGWYTLEAEPGLLTGLLVMGPLLWTATLLINDAYDVAGDRLNPRKAVSPLVRGEVSRGATLAGAYLFAGLSLLVAASLGWTFLTLVAACLVLAWAYSVPPVRLKTLPGADVVVNAVGVGVLSALAGWSLAAPLAAFPFALLWQGVLVAAAVYVPTTLVDQAADRAAGYTTLATHLGHRRAYRVGWWAWIGANLGALGLSALSWVIPRAMLPVLIVFVPLMLWEYHRFIGQADGPEAMVEGILLCSLTFLAVNLLFGLLYVGLWTP